MTVDNEPGPVDELLPSALYDWNTYIENAMILARPSDGGQEMSLEKSFAMYGYRN